MNKGRLITALLSTSLLLCACNQDPSSSTIESSTQQDQEILEPTEFGKDPLLVEKEAIEPLFQEDYADEQNGILLEKIEGANYFKNGKYLAKPDSFIQPEDDVKMEFFTQSHARFVDVSNGYSVTIPIGKNYKVDYQMAKNGVKFVNDKETIRLSYETIRPYAHTAQFYNTYMREWVLPYITKDAYFTENNIEAFLPSLDQSKSVLSGYTVTTFHLKVNGLTKLDKSYYNFAFIKKNTTFEGFFFIHLKSTSDDQTSFNELLHSYKRLSPNGTPRIYLPKQTSIANPKWNAMTKAYYEKMKQKKVPDWGYFIESFPNTITDDGQAIKEYIDSELAWMESEEYTDHKSELISTYSHISWYGLVHSFPLDASKAIAGGDGKNGKKVLEYSYQFTINNNSVNPSKENDVKSPTLDIFRGIYDEQFHKLAQDIKAYEKPILFRLNNEMNTDWTSYCGLFNLLDPELFVASWQYLYNIFEEEGVDNCIWIWNPFDDSYPCSNWGDYFSYYPGDKYVQVLGLTSYEFNNYEAGAPDSRKGFNERFSNLYEMNKDYFLDLPWFVGEFACGAGGSPGEIGRNQDYQAAYVKEMFESIKAEKEFTKPIKGYIWFSKNDTGEEGIINYLKIDKELRSTIAEFKKGFHSIHG